VDTNYYLDKDSPFTPYLGAVSKEKVKKPKSCLEVAIFLESVPLCVRLVTDLDIYLIIIFLINNGGLMLKNMKRFGFFMSQTIL